MEDLDCLVDSLFGESVGDASNKDKEIILNETPSKSSKSSTRVRSAKSRKSKSRLNPSASSIANISASLSRDYASKKQTFKPSEASSEDSSKSLSINILSPSGHLNRIGFAPSSMSKCTESISSSIYNQT